MRSCNMKVTEVCEIEGACPYCDEDDLSIRAVHGQSAKGRILNETRYCVVCDGCLASGPVAKSRNEAVALFNKGAHRGPGRHEAQPSLFDELA